MLDGGGAKAQRLLAARALAIRFSEAAISSSALLALLALRLAILSSLWITD